MYNRHHSHKKTLFGKDILILPFVFCAVIYIICALVIIPSSSSWLSLASIFFSDHKKDFSAEYTNIFVPVEDESAPAAPSIKQESSTEQRKQQTVNLSGLTFPSYEDQFGELTIEDCQIKAKLFFGDSRLVLSNGVGIYSGSAIPGYGRTILVAGHNNTYFNGLKYARKGQIIRIRTNYGNYQYEITDLQIKDKNDRSAYELSAESESLVLYTCYPFDDPGLTPDRYFVYAKPVSGPVIDKTR